MAAAFSLPLKYLLHTEWHLFPTACLRALRVRSTVGSSSVLRNYGHYPQIQGNGRTGRQLSEMNVSLKFGGFFFKDFIYLFDRDRDSQREREHKQGEWERKKQAHSGGARCGAQSHNAGITP